MKSLNLNKALLCLKSGLLVTLLFFALGAQKLNAQTPIFGGVEITTVDSTEVGDTDPHWDVRFKADTTGTNGNANGGWIIQKITMSLKVNPCPGVNKPKIDTTVTYFEVWKVAAGSDTSAPEFPNGAGDRWGANPAFMADGTYGSFSITGAVGFVTNPAGGNPATPGDLGGPDTNRTDGGGSTWGSGAGAVPEAGGLISTYNEPSFWGDLDDSGKLKTRTWLVTWNKCAPEDTSVVEDPVEEDTTIVEDPIDEEIPADGDGDGKSKLPIGNSSQINSQNLTFYPNPAKTELTTRGADAIKTSIYSISGEILLDSDKKQIDIQDLAPGIYIIHLSNGTEITKDFLIIE